MPDTLSFSQISSAVSDSCKQYRHDHELYQELVQEAWCAAWELAISFQKKEKDLSVSYLKKSLRRPVARLFMKYKTPYSMPFNNDFNASVNYIRKSDVRVFSESDWELHAGKIGVSVHQFKSAYMYLYSSSVPLSSVSVDNEHDSESLDEKLLVEIIDQERMKLSAEDSNLINARFFSDKKESYSSIGNRMGCSHTAAIKRERSILSKLLRSVSSSTLLNKELDF